MKRYKIILFFVFLYPISPIYACIYEPDDNDDITWSIDLDEFVVWPDGDSDNSEEDDWWRHENDEGEYDDEEDYYGYWMNTDDDDGYYYAAGSNGGSNNEPYTIKTGDKVVAKIELPAYWAKQDKKGNCLPTAMEYASAILCNAKSRDVIADDYRKHFDSDRNIDRDGIPVDKIDAFMKMEFYASIVSPSSIIMELDNNNILLYDMDGRTNGLFPTCAHEIVIMGYTEDKKYLIYLDPHDGNYHKEDKNVFWNQRGTVYSITGVK